MHRGLFSHNSIEFEAGCPDFVFKLTFSHTYAKITIKGKERKTMKLLIGYLFLINLAGLFSMCIDKRRARSGKYRISEHMLMFIAVLGGSAGSLIGMHLFRHKTRHLKFSVGIPFVLFVQVILIMIIASSFHADAGGPSAAVKRKLDQITYTDTENTQALFLADAFSGYDILYGNEESAARAFQLFFKDFRYEITDEQISGDDAVVSVNITNLDTHMLAHDICLHLISRWIGLFAPAGEGETTVDYFSLLADTIESGLYPSVGNTVAISLTREKHVWQIDEDQDLSGKITGGFISWLSDPYILSAEEVLTLYMDSLGSLDADGWFSYLNAGDLFDTGSEKYAVLADKAYTKYLAKYFSWELVSVSQDMERAQTKLNITSVDMNAVLNSFHEKLLSYASTTDAITSDSDELSDTCARLLEEAFNETAAPEHFTATVTLYNDGVTWQPDDSSELITAILGDIPSAMEIMRNIKNESGE